jgi:chaperonin GroES
MQSNLKYTYEPTGINVLVSKILPESTTTGGILLPERALPDDGIYTVVAMGNGVQRDGSVYTPSYGIGDKVLLPSYMGTPIPENNDYKIIPMDTVISVVREK